jgi:hypothetical protein
VERRETILFYLLGVVALVVASILSTNQIERVEIGPLPTNTPAIVITPRPTATPAEISRRGCATIPQAITFGYLPDTATLTNLTGDALTVSGTVYAADFTIPLQEVLIEVWQARPKIGDDNFLPFIWLKQVRTGADGWYEFTSPKPGRYSLILPLIGYVPDRYMPTYFHYRLSYLGRCPHFGQLLYADTAYDPSGKPSPPKLLIKQMKPAVTMLQGPVDLALPISSPASQ